MGSQDADILFEITEELLGSKGGSSDNKRNVRIYDRRHCDEKTENKIE